MSANISSQRQEEGTGFGEEALPNSGQKVAQEQILSDTSDRLKRQKYKQEIRQETQQNLRSFQAGALEKWNKVGPIEAIPDSSNGRLMRNIITGDTDVWISNAYFKEMENGMDEGTPNQLKNWKATSEEMSFQESNDKIYPQQQDDNTVQETIQKHAEEYDKNHEDIPESTEKSNSEIFADADEVTKSLQDLFQDSFGLDYEKIDISDLEDDPLEVVENISDFGDEEEMNKKLFAPFFKLLIEKNAITEEVIQEFKKIIENTGSKENMKERISKEKFIIIDSKGTEILSIIKMPPSISMTSTKKVAKFEGELTLENMKKYMENGEFKYLLFEKSDSITQAGDKIIVEYDNYFVEVTENKDNISFKIVEVPEIEDTDKTVEKAKKYDEEDEKDTSEEFRNKKAQNLINKISQLNSDFSELIIDGDIQDGTKIELQAQIIDIYAGKEFPVRSYEKYKDKKDKWEKTGKILIKKDVTIDTFLKDGNFTKENIQILEKIYQHKINIETQKILSDISGYKIEPKNIKDKDDNFIDNLDGKIGINSKKALKKVVNKNKGKNFKITINGKTKQITIGTDIGIFFKESESTKEDIILALEKNISEEGLLILQEIAKERNT